MIDEVEPAPKPQPARRPNSVRRTVTHDSLRPDGLLKPVTVLAQGRDVYTGSDDAVQVLDQARLRLKAGYLERSIISISSEPAKPALDSLVGDSPLSGFRDRVGQLMADERAQHTVLFRLLVDLPPALLVSGRALRAAGIRIEMSGRTPNPVGFCAGWVEGGTVLQGLTSDGVPLHVGPIAGALFTDNDPFAWHEVHSLPPHGTRRVRLLDVWETSTEVDFEGYFRDTHCDEAGVETVVHEYGVSGSVDSTGERFLSCTAVPGALPYPECPNAAPSSQRLVGAHLEKVVELVRHGFAGPSTCTHLNDSFRSLEDISGLARALRRSVSHRS